jgi:hypothetical protein
MSARPFRKVIKSSPKYSNLAIDQSRGRGEGGGGGRLVLRVVNRNGRMEREADQNGLLQCIKEAYKVKPLSR